MSLEDKDPFMPWAWPWATRRAPSPAFDCRRLGLADAAISFPAPQPPMCLSPRVTAWARRAASEAWAHARARTPAEAWGPRLRTGALEGAAGLVQGARDASARGRDPGKAAAHGLVRREGDSPPRAAGAGHLCVRGPPSERGERAPRRLRPLGPRVRRSGPSRPGPGPGPGRAPRWRGSQGSGLGVGPQERGARGARGQRGPPGPPVRPVEG